jgi:hypothetical protein
VIWPFLCGEDEFRYLNNLTKTVKLVDVESAEALPEATDAQKINVDRKDCALRRGAYMRTPKIKIYFDGCADIVGCL